MKEVKNAIIRRYEHGNYFVDIICQGSYREAWLTKKTYGYATLMWGEEENQVLYGKPTKVSYDDFLDMVEANLPEYIESYEEDMDIFDMAMNTHFMNLE